MTYSTIVGLIFTVIGLFLYIINEPDYTYKEFYIAGMLGLGIGLLIGGFLGFAQKRRKKIIQPQFEQKKEAHFKESAKDSLPDDSGLNL